MKECRVVDVVVASGWRENENGEWGDWPDEYANDVIPVNAFGGKQSLVYFVFPEEVTKILGAAFANSNLSGPLVLPDAVTIIGESAFAGTNISSIQFPTSLKRIENNAFCGCTSASGDLIFPEGLISIGDASFYIKWGGHGGFNGYLIFPESLESIGNTAFCGAGSFKGGLIIPENVVFIGNDAFNFNLFGGSLSLNNVHSFGECAFQSCGFCGELVVPEGVLDIPSHCFGGNNFTLITLPSTLKTIGEGAFGGAPVFKLVFPEGLVSIGANAFNNCRFILDLNFPSTLQTIKTGAFMNCYNVSSITCSSIEPPIIQEGAFDGVGKDNLTVEVPPQSVKRYQSESGWSDFKRIAAHYDFSISRSLIQANNGEYSRTLTLMAPSGFNWSIQDKPDWVTVEPSSGTGKMDVTITVSEMSRTNDTFEVNEGSFNDPSYVNYKGRSGEVVFLLNDKEYTSTLTVEQYDCDYADGSVRTLQTHTQGAGIDIVFTGDGYSARDIAKGTLIANAEEGYGHFFDVEPYKTYKDYFNVYLVTAMSEESGIGTVNTIVDTKFGSTFSQNRLIGGDSGSAFAWAKKADPGMDLTRSLVIMLMNTSVYEGVTMMYTDGSAIACCPVSRDAYPYDFRGIIQHEAGGHGFGKLGDEYIYHNAFIQNCRCLDGCEHPQGDYDLSTSYGVFKSLDWYKNLSMSSDPSQVPWAHLIYHPRYSDYVDIFEGGYMHSRGMYRSEATSCMNNNIPYYSAISRQAIVERIMYCSGQEFSLESFYANDKDDFGPITKGGLIDRTFGVDPKFFRATGQGPILMGDHPNVK